MAEDPDGLILLPKNGINLEQLSVLGGQQRKIGMLDLQFHNRDCVRRRRCHVLFFSPFPIFLGKDLKDPLNKPFILVRKAIEFMDLTTLGGNAAFDKPLPDRFVTEGGGELSRRGTNRLLAEASGNAKRGGEITVSFDVEGHHDIREDLACTGYPRYSLHRLPVKIARPDTNGVICRVSDSPIVPVILRCPCFYCTFEGKLKSMAKRRPACIGVLEDISDDVGNPIGEETMCRFSG